MPEPGSEAADLLQRGEPRDRARAARTLKDPSAAGAALIEDRAFDPDPEVRALALRLLAERRSPSSEEVLLSALADECPDVALSAAEALAARRHARAADAISECIAARSDLAGPLALALARLGDPGVEDLLWVELEGETADRATRGALLRAVGSCGGARSAASLRALLGGAARDDHPAAAAALLEILEREPGLEGSEGLPAGALEALPALLGSTDARLRRAGIALARHARSVEAVALLLAAAADPDPGIAGRALEALPGAARGREEQLLVSLGARRPEEAAAALDHLGALEGEGARSALLRLLEDAAPRVREAAAALAGRSGLPGLAPGLTRLLSDPVGHVRARAAAALGALGAVAARPRLAALLRDPYPDVREAALDALRALRGGGSGPESIEVPPGGAERPAPGARAALLRALDPREHPGLLEDALADGDPDVRAAAAHRLAELGFWSDAAAVLLLDEDPRVRAHAARARLLARPLRPLEPLRPLLRDPDPGVRQAFASGLAGLPGPEALPWLEVLLRDGDAAVARAAARGLGRHRNSGGVRALLDVLSSAGLPVRAAAIEALAAIGDPEALPRLRAVARGGDAPLREAAAAAVRRIEGARR